MTLLDALLELLERVGACNGAAVLVSEEDLSGWPADAVRELKAHRLLVKASPAGTAVCPGCEQECNMPVETVPAGTGRAASFIVCDKREDINRVAVPTARLRQWRCGVEAVGAWAGDGQEAQPDGVPASQRRAGTGGRKQLCAVG